MPKRIQRTRKKGWKTPEGAIYVGRPTMRGNRYVIGERIRHVDGIAHFVYDAAEAKRLYIEWLDHQLTHIPHLRQTLKDELGGHDLTCWCDLDQPCHADVLLEIANG